MKKPIISFVVAMSKQTRAIGKNGDLLWRIPRDQQFFKEVTMGHPMVMGRKTFESIGRILPGRTSIVVTRNPDWKYDGVLLAHSVEDALQQAMALDTEEVCIIGGEQIFSLALPLVTRIYLTEINDELHGTAYFPEFDEDIFRETSREEGEHEGITYTISTLERKK